MKKIIYIVVIALATSMALTSCTEEISPAEKPHNGGGNGSLDPL